MIDHLVGRPSPSWKRAQVFLVIFFWLWRIAKGNAGPPRILWLRKINRALKHFTPWQIVVSTLTAVYALRNVDKILGLGSPEPLARLYSPSYYRATWIAIGLDAGFATAMSIRPKWLRDLCSVVFAGYYILYANEADEKIRRFRAVPTVEMLRTTWEKSTNPYVRLMMYLPHVPVKRKILLPRPKNSRYTRSITAFLFFKPKGRQLNEATDLILDLPGGGFVAMSPEHHEERIRLWAVKTGKPILSIDYGKAPEYPYPYAIDEVFDAYRVLVESVGRVIGMSGKHLNIIISGDSAGGTLAVNIILKLLEYNHSVTLSHESTTLPQPLALVLNYAALDFNFTSWMSPAHLRVLRWEQSSGNLPGLMELASQKDHFQHTSPLSMVKDDRFSTPRRKGIKRRSSWKDTFRDFTSGGGRESDLSPGSQVRQTLSAPQSPNNRTTRSQGIPDDIDNVGVSGDARTGDEEEDHDMGDRKEEDWPISARVRYACPPVSSPVSRSDSLLSHEQQLSDVFEGIHEETIEITESGGLTEGKEPIGTRLTMTSRTGYFQDRIVSPSMMRAMAILYIGPYRNPDFATDYHLSPILTPGHLLAQFPPLLLQCGEKDPFVDDTVIFAGRVREAKRARKAELELTISGKSARFGEGLRMSRSPDYLGDNYAEVQRERDKLARETEEDWVQMVLFSDWSHAYLQMPALMPEAKAVIEELAEWIDQAFQRNADQGNLQADQIKTNEPACQPSPSSEAEADDPGITFAPKKYQSGSPATRLDEQGPELSAREDEFDAEGASARILSASQKLEHESRKEHALPRTPESRVVGGTLRLTPQLAETPKGSGSRQAGTPITETEMMRRRRLLDSHIFE